MMNWINKKRNKKGFTLVELVVVIAILGILAAVAVPRFANQTTKAQESADAASIRTVESAISMAIAEGELIYNPAATGTALVLAVKGGSEEANTAAVMKVLVPKYLDKTPISQKDSTKALTISIGAPAKEIIVKFGS